MAPESVTWQSLLGLGLVLAAALGLGFGLGYAADSALDSSPTFVLIGMAVALVAGVAFAVVRFKQYLKS